MPLLLSFAASDVIFPLSDGTAFPWGRGHVPRGAPSASRSLNYVLCWQLSPALSVPVCEVHPSAAVFHSGIFFPKRTPITLKILMLSYHVLCNVLVPVLISGRGLATLPLQNSTNNSILSMLWPESWRCSYCRCTLPPVVIRSSWPSRAVGGLLVVRHRRYHWRHSRYHRHTADSVCGSGAATLRLVSPLGSFGFSYRLSSGWLR